MMCAIRSVTDTLSGMSPSPSGHDMRGLRSTAVGITRRFRATVIAVALVSLIPTVASAQTSGDKDVACQDRRQAKREFNKGRLAYRRGDYEEAILKWQESYAMCEEPLIHLNIANAYERLGDLEPALDHLKKWRLVAPLREHGELDARIAGLSTRVAELQKEKAASQATEDAAQRAEEEQKAREAADPQKDRAKQDEASGGIGTMNIIGISLVGVGGAAAIAGVIMDAVAASKRPDEAQACTDMSGRLLCRDAQRADIESSNTLALAGDITWIAGAVVAAGGATVLVLTATGVLSVGVGGDETSKSDAVIQDLRIGTYGSGLRVFGRF